VDVAFKVIKGLKFQNRLNHKSRQFKLTAFVIINIPRIRTGQYETPLINVTLYHALI
jgi:hypothetical protein